MSSAAAQADWQGTLERLDGVVGLISDEQAERLWRRARELLPGDTIVEIGSYQGRSTIALALGAPEDTQLIAIDPYLPSAPDAPFDEGEDAMQSFFENLRSRGVEDRVRQIRRRSSEAADEVRGDIQLLWIDGDHGYGAVCDDIRTWGPRVPPGAAMLLHDAWSSVLVTGAIFRTIAFDPRWQYVGRSGSMVEYRRAVAGAGGWLGSVGRQIAELPWFLRNIVIKASLIFGARPVARLLGHDSDLPPY